MSLEDNCGKFGRTKMIFFVTLPGGLILCVPGQYRVFPPLAAIIAASRRGILATRRWRRCTGICAHLSSRAWRSSSRFWGGLSIELIARPNSSQRCSMGLQSGDLGGCSIFVTLPWCRKSRTTPWKAPHTWTEPPPAWTLWAWHPGRKRSPGKRRTLSLPSTG